MSSCEENEADERNNEMGMESQWRAHTREGMMRVPFLKAHKAVVWRIHLGDKARPGGQ